MHKNILFYFIAFMLLLAVLLFFNTGYRELTTYSALTNRHNAVYSCFQNLSKQINNAAILNPDLVKAAISSKAGKLFFTDSLTIIRQLDLLKSIVRDSVNIQIAKELDTGIRSELSWLLKSNVPDSIIHHRSPAHIAAFQSIDSLINQGTQRTIFLIEYRKNQLDEEIGKGRTWVMLFTVLSGILLIYTTINLFRQRSKTKRKEKELETVFNRVNDAVVSVDNYWRYTFLNDAAMATHPLSKEKTLGKIIWDVHPEMKGTIFWDKYHEAMQTGKVVEIEDHYAPMDIWFSVKVYPSSDGLTIFYKDVTESKRAEQVLAKTLKEITDFKFALDESSIVVITDQEGIIKHVNNNFCKISKYSREELIGQDLRIINSGYHHKEFMRNLWVTIGNGNIWKGELRNKAKDGSIYWVDTTIVPFLDDKGKPYQYIAIRADITERKQAEDRLASSEMRFRSLIESSADGIALTDEFSNNIYRSPAAQKIMGNVAKENTISFSHPDDLETIKNKRALALKNPGMPVAFQGRFLHSLGHYIWLEGTLTNLLHVSEVNALVTNFQDITARKEAEEKLIASEKRFRALIENSYDVISLMDESLKVIYRSPSATRITGWTNEELKDRNDSNIHPDDLAGFKEIGLEIMANPGKAINVSFRNLHKQGHYLWVEGTVTNLLQDEDVKAIVFNFRDITQRKEAEEKLTKSEKIYKTIASSIPGSVICLLDTDFRYLLIEGDMLEKLGYSKEKLLGNKAKDVLPPEIFESVQKEFKKVLEGDTVTRESSSNGYDIISRFIPLKDENNIVYTIMTVAIDITKLKKAQRDIAELNRGLEEKITRRTEQLRNTNKELEDFSYSVSHDLRAPLRIINGFGQILMEDYSSKLDGEGQRTIKVIMNSARKMGQLIDDLLDFSKSARSEITMSAVNMNELVEEAIQELETGGMAIPVKLKQHKLRTARGDSRLLKQVWINLISNAIKYSGAKKDPIIEIGMIDEKDKHIYYVKDNGAGFDMQYAGKLFAVFQRLHKEEEFTGTGVGLALVQRIIVRHGGNIWAEAKVNEGAVFYFTLPG
jgi:PAS domain S-box-containing protein